MINDTAPYYQQTMFEINTLTIYYMSRNNVNTTTGHWGIYWWDASLIIGVYEA